MKHDMKGHTAMLSGLFAAGRFQEAAGYLKVVEKEVDNLSGQCEDAGAGKDGRNILRICKEI